MASEDHFKLLKQGASSWNRWRQENVDIRPDLQGAALSGLYLSGFNLIKANLSWANLRQANLSKANLSESYLTKADLSQANLNGADLYGADLGSAILNGTRLRWADLRGVDFNRVDLSQADLSQAKLRGANFSQARVGYTAFGGVDLSRVQGLDTVRHLAPSIIGIDTIFRSGGKIPKNFLQQAGVPDDLIKALENSAAIAAGSYSSNQIESWLTTLQKELDLVLENLANRRKIKSNYGPDTPLPILNEIECLEAEKSRIEAEFTNFANLLKQHSQQVNQSA